MKKSLITAVFTLGLISNAFADCDTTPYNAPEELRPVCTEAASVASDSATTAAEKTEAKAEIVSEKRPSAYVTKKRVTKEVKAKK